MRRLSAWAIRGRGTARRSRLTRIRTRNRSVYLTCAIQPIVAGGFLNAITVFVALHTILD